MTHMDFYDFWRIATPAEKQDLAKKMHTTVQYLSAVAHGRQRVTLRFRDLMRYVTGVMLEFDNCCGED